MIMSTSIGHAQDAKGKAVLDMVQKKITGIKALKSNFSFTMSNGHGKSNTTKSGTLAAKGNKYHIAVTNQEIICDGTTVWTYNKEAKEVQVSSYNPDEQSITPTKLFSNTYEKDYSYKYVGASTVNGKKCSVVELTPHKAVKGIQKIELAADAAGTIAGGTVYQKNGGKITYSVSNFQPNATVADSYFTFDKAKYPGVEVVDLR